MENQRKWTDRLPRIRGFSDGTLLAISILLLLNSLSSYWRYSAQFPKIDYFCFWAVSQSLSNRPIENIYSADGQKEMAREVSRLSELPGTSERQKQVTSAVLRFYDGRLSATGTPFMLGIIGALSSGNYDQDEATFLVCSFLLYCTSILILCVLLRFSPISTLLTLTLLLSSYQPLFSNLRNGNLTAIQLFIITIFILVLGRSKHAFREIIAGLVLGLGIMFKPNLVLILPLSLAITVLRRDFKKSLGLLAGSGLGIAIAIIYSSTFFGGLEIWTQFLSSLPNPLHLFSLNQGNFSVINLVHSLTGKDLSTVTMALLTALFIYLTWSSHRGIGESHDKLESSDHHNERYLREVFLAAGVGATIMLVSANLTWLHYFILVIPLALLLMRPVMGSDRQSRQSAGLRVLAIAALSLLTPLFMRGTNPLYLCLIINTASVMLLIGGYYEIWHLREELRQRTQHPA